MLTDLFDLDKFLENWWDTHAAKDVTSRDLLLVALKDRKFRQYYENEASGNHAAISKIGSELYRISRRRGVIPGFKLSHKSRKSQADKVSRFSIEKETESSPQKENTAPYGFRVHEEEFSVLCNIQQLGELGFSNGAIVAGLNEDKVTRRGQKWTRKTVQDCFEKSFSTNPEKEHDHAFTCNGTKFMIRELKGKFFLSQDEGTSWDLIPSREEILKLDIPHTVMMWAYLCIMGDQTTSKTQFVAQMDCFLSKLT